MKKHHSGSEWELKWWFVDRRNEVVGQKWKKSGPEKWGWIGEKWADRSEKQKKKTHRERRLNQSLDRERRVRWRRSERRLDRSLDRSVRGVDRSLIRRVGGVDRSLFVDRNLFCRLRGVDRSDFLRVLGVDRSLFRRLCGVDRSLDRLKCVGVEWIGAWLRRLRRAWIVVRRCGSFRLARCVGRSSEALRDAVRVWERSACEREEEKVWSENMGWKWFPSFLASFSVKLKIFLVWPNLPCQPSTIFSGKWFPNFIFSQNKRSLNLHIVFAHKAKVRYCF